MTYPEIYPEGYGFDYIALIRKSDGKEVYSSPAHTLGNNNALDLARVKKNLNFYFDRVNSGIQQQLESPRTSPEQKAELKLLDKGDYQVFCKKCVPMGYCQKISWKLELNEFLN